MENVVHKFFAFQPLDIFSTLVYSVLSTQGNGVLKKGRVSFGID